MDRNQSTPTVAKPREVESSVVPASASPQGGRPASPADHATGPGLLGRLGSWSAVHRRVIALTWVAVIAFFAVFDPGVEKALSGAGWQANGSQSVQVRTLAQKYFGGQASSAIEVVVTANRPIDGP